MCCSVTGGYVEGWRALLWQSEAQGGSRAVQKWARLLARRAERFPTGRRGAVPYEAPAFPWRAVGGEQRPQREVRVIGGVCVGVK